MTTPGVHVCTLHNPRTYTTAQLDQATAIAHLLNRGQFILAEPPRR
jgi:hypothetical protein